MSDESPLHRLSVVIPVYRGEQTLAGVVRDILGRSTPQEQDNVRFAVEEIVLVCDGAVDGSAAVMRSLSESHPQVKCVWLSRNFGQHPATLAGIAATASPWVVTMDEDGQHDPADIGALLAAAVRDDVQLAYAAPRNTPGHGMWRNLLSGTTHWIFANVLGNSHIGAFHSFRLIDGEIARSLSAYAGHSVFLDAALSWVVARAVHVPVQLRSRETRPSGYSFRSLTRHFWRLLLTSGTQPLRFIAAVGVLSILAAAIIAAYAVWAKWTRHVPVEGWTSLVVVVSFFSGCILFALGVIAEYLAVALGIVMGKPLYLAVSRSRSPRRP